MRIAILATRYHINQHYWVKALLNAGHTVEFYVSDSDSAEVYSALSPIIIPKTVRPKWQTNILQLVQKMRGTTPQQQFNYEIDTEFLRDTLARFNPEVVIVRDLFYPLSMAGFKVAKELNAPAIHYNQFPIENREALPTRILKRLKIVSDVRITPSRTTDIVRNELTNSWYVPLITDITYDVTKKTYLPQNNLRLLFVGKFKSKRKKHLLMLKAFADIAQRRPAHLTMVGSDTHSDPEYYSLILQKIKTLGIARAVTIRHDLSHEDMLRLYASHDIFILPSTHEPYAISPLEAMSYGLPIVLTESNGGKKVVDDGVTGYIIPDNSADAIVSAVMNIADSKDRVRAMGMAAHARKNEMYSPYSFLQHFYNVVTNLGIKQ
jgi:glycosyltransferase involved in cell wall biosynthesis